MELEPSVEARNKSISEHEQNLKALYGIWNKIIIPRAKDVITVISLGT